MNGFLSIFSPARGLSCAHLGTDVDLGSIRLEGRKGVRAIPPRCRRTFGSCQVQVLLLLRFRSSCWGFGPFLLCDLPQSQMHCLRYLTDLVRSRRPLPRRQELQSMTFVLPDSEAETALVSHQEVQTWAEGNRNAIICSISHAWETREHPDPCRYQLEQIAQRVALYEAAFKADVWVFYDYASLFQFERFSPEEKSSFGAAMQNMHVMYAHEHTLTLRIESLTPDDVWNRMMANETELVRVYDKDEKNVVAKPLKDLFPNRNAYTSRGWCMAEVEWSSLRSGSQNVHELYLDLFWRHAAYKCLQHIMSPVTLQLLRTVNLQHQRIDGVDDHSGDGSRLNGRIPMTPENFRSKMEKAVFTHRSDAESVIRLQEKDLLRKGDGLWAPGVGRPSGRSSAGIGWCFATLQELEKLEAENRSMWRRAGWSPCKGTLGTLTRNITWSCNVFAFFSLHVSTRAHGRHSQPADCKCSQSAMTTPRALNSWSRHSWGPLFNNPCFFMCGWALHKNIWCKKDIGWLVQDGVRRKGFVKDVLRKHGA